MPTILFYKAPLYIDYRSHLTDDKTEPHGYNHLLRVIHEYIVELGLKFRSYSKAQALVPYICYLPQFPRTTELEFKMRHHTFYFIPLILETISTFTRFRKDVVSLSPRR